MKIEISNDKLKTLLDYIEAENKQDENVEIANIALELSIMNKKECELFGE